MRQVFIFLLILDFSLGIACRKSFPRSRFVALYEAEHENGTETVELFSDGTYLQQFKAKDGIESTSSGTWELSIDHQTQAILVHSFTLHFPGHPTTPTDRTLEVYEDYGLMRLYVSRQPRQFYLELPRK
ncbi:MAG: hypothetical protein LAO22_16690 [Acidobacteriia bacterium]|nr:hypothetical protein [Terriglobia bacterium]